eukprot:Skav205645  [mRNA]  locus=scaffold458:102049:111369:- [translate_table: standard]
MQQSFSSSGSVVTVSCCHDHGSAKKALQDMPPNQCLAAQVGSNAGDGGLEQTARPASLHHVAQVVNGLLGSLHHSETGVHVDPRGQATIT